VRGEQQGRGERRGEGGGGGEAGSVIAVAVAVAVGGWQWQWDIRIGCVSAVILIGGKLGIGGKLPESVAGWIVGWGGRLRSFLSGGRLIIGGSGCGSGRVAVAVGYSG
jgi:hypothetical protein